MRIKIIFDTNCLVSTLLSPDSRVADSFRRGLEIGVLLTSEECFKEVVGVLQRPKFRKYYSNDELLFFQSILLKELQFQLVKSNVSICRDPKDDKFLNLALESQADFLITGDNDLLTLKRFNNTEIISPREFLEKFK